MPNLTFCFSLMGDGFSSRFDDGVIHGCAAACGAGWRLTGPCTAWLGNCSWRLRRAHCSGSAGLPPAACKTGLILPQPAQPRSHCRAPPRPIGLPPCPRSCIPVMIHDSVEPSWASLLDTDSYTLRVAQADMARVPDILAAVPPADVERMRANLARVWRRRAARSGAGGGWARTAVRLHLSTPCLKPLLVLLCAPSMPPSACRHLWTGYRPYGEMAQGIMRKHAAAGGNGSGGDSTSGSESSGSSGSQVAPDAKTFDPGQDDALATLLQWLYARADTVGAHARRPSDGSGSSSIARRRARR